MDNRVRAAEKLAGKQSLGVDLPTEIQISRGLEVIGPWYQSAPKDFSVPQMRWYSWGYEDHAMFAAKIRIRGAGPARIAIRGQACTDKMCKNIDVEISLPLPPNAAPPARLDLNHLVPVR
jgi:hypothetical protein